MKTTKTIIFSSLVMTTVFFAGCSSEKDNNLNPINDTRNEAIQIEKPISNQVDNLKVMQEPTPSQNKSANKDRAAKSEPEENIENENSNVEFLNYENETGLEIKNNEIFFYGKKRGWISKNRIFLNFEDNVYSFEHHNGIDKLDFHPIENFESVVYYDGLTINFPKDDDIKIAYQCNGPLLQERPYEYCKTNGIDNLQQYEFGGAYRQFSTGGGFGLSWNNIFIKKINDKNIVFEGGMNSTIIDTDPSFIPLESLGIYRSLLKYGFVKDLNINTELQNTAFQNDQEKRDFEEIQKKLEPIHAEMRNIVKSKKYLDKLKNDPINLKNEEKYQKIINSFLIEKK